MSTSRGQASIMVKTVGVEATFLVVHAGSDRGYRLARDLLEAGSRVAVTSRYATDIARILHGYPAEQVLTIAADESQLNQVINRVESRWAASTRSSTPTPSVTRSPSGTTAYRSKRPRDQGGDERQALAPGLQRPCPPVPAWETFLAPKALAHRIR
jgi:hypothetical protein